MAGAIRYISRINLNTFMSNTTRQLFFNESRTLYTESSLGLSDYKATRASFLSKYQLGLDAFLTKMKKSVEHSNEMIFTEDLKAILHLVEKKPEEIQLLQDMIQKYNNQGNEIRFSSFTFGPIVMRALYYVNEPDTAKTLYLNPKYEAFFNQTTTSMILLDLLYENGKYQDIREVYDVIRQKPLESGKTHSKFITSIVAMSCYKENTPESLEYVLQICKELCEMQINPIRKFLSLISALALNQNKPHIALETLSLCVNMDYISTRSLRVMALADLGRIDEVINILQVFINTNSTSRTFDYYYPDVITKIRDAIKRLNIDESSTIYDLLQTIEDKGFIYVMTLDTHLSQPMDDRRAPRIPSKHKDQPWNNNSYNSSMYSRNQ